MNSNSRSSAGKRSLGVTLQGSICRITACGHQQRTMEIWFDVMLHLTFSVPPSTFTNVGSGLLDLGLVDERLLGTDLRDSLVGCNLGTPTHIISLRRLLPELRGPFAKGYNSPARSCDAVLCELCAFRTSFIVRADDFRKCRVWFVRHYACAS